MTITATAAGVSATIKVNRPSWQEMIKHYKPDGFTKYQLYPLISSALAKDADKPAYANTCALRMSYALNKSGVLLGKAPSNGGTIVGDDKKNYWLRVRDLKEELKKRFKNPDYSYTHDPFPQSWNPATQQNVLSNRVSKTHAGILDDIKNRRGIVIFEVEGWTDASGHFTLWDGPNQNLLYVGASQEEKDPRSSRFYFWMVPNPLSSGLTKSISFWELK